MEVEKEVYSSYGVEKRRLVICPHCGGHVSVGITTEIEAVLKWVDRETTDSWREGLTADQVGIIDTAQSTGLLKAFGEAVERRVNHASAAPRNLERFFLTVLKTMSQKRVPSFVLQHYIQEFGRNTRTEVWSSQGICIVIANGRIKAFVPLDVFVGSPIRSLNPGTGCTSRLGGDEQTFQAWIKTRFGYVPDSSPVFLAELRRKSVGDFARPSVSA